MSAVARNATSAALAFALLIPSSSFAQEPTPAPPAQSPEVELNLITLSTTRSLNRHQSYFRVTHRFNRDLGTGSFGQLLEDLFSLDNGATIGLEYRFGVTANLQAGVNRTALGKTIQFFGRYDRWRQSDSVPLSISLLGSVEGLGNFQDDFQPALAATVSRVAAPWLVLYASPTFVWNAEAADSLDQILPGAEEDENSDHEDSFFMGLGARVRFRPTAYIVVEYSPRLAGYDPGPDFWGVGIEKATRGGRHTFQLNFTNGFGTTLGQISRGGVEEQVFLGFNITRRF
jgi:hypothetical protein